ncbi:hypothetical protein IWQ60_012004 [Tieghemiomyces parasiticus]|uniref:Uncharacterized protein n=1 Tax=Tieghemiomyces parasiticus TaxID=78921 RepID=A0A9W8DHY8_9FUNG|nr:hypothetical protein IWQ60_012004 [Tieghemiomyces parasiticus]
MDKTPDNRSAHAARVNQYMRGFNTPSPSPTARKSLHNLREAAAGQQAAPPALALSQSVYQQQASPSFGSSAGGLLGLLLHLSHNKNLSKLELCPTNVHVIPSLDKTHYRLC